MESTLESKRYYSFRGEDGYFRGHSIMDMGQVAVLSHYNKQAEHFAAIEYYDQDNRVIGSPLSFDVDFEGNLNMAYHVTKMLCDRLTEFGLKYKAWFSGGKGFHVVVPKIIEGDKAHTIAKAIKRVYFNIKGVDEKIYRVQSLFRVEGSVNAKSSLYKIPIDPSWTLDYILKKAEEPIPLNFNLEIDESIDLLPLVNGSKHMFDMLQVTERHDAYDSEYETSLCIKKMWADDDPPRDQWHSIIYTLVKHFYSSGYNSHEITEKFDEHPFWSSICTSGYNRRSYTKIINSLGRSTKHGIGCKNGASAECMRYYCTPLCFIDDRLTMKDLLWHD